MSHQISTAAWTILLLASSSGVNLAGAHGYLKELIARTAIQRRPEFNTSAPYWWDAEGVWCGNVYQNLEYSTCGRCGDRFGETTANQDGVYDKKVIVAVYGAGSVISVDADVTAPHYGHFTLELCPHITETDDCFQLLPILSASGGEGIRDSNRVCVGFQDSPFLITAQVQLPRGVRCERCTLRWTYRTSYQGRPDWDPCDNAHEAQTFRNCADVQIK